MLNAPVPSARKILKRTGMTLDDIDLFEVNEAFAVVSEKYMRDLELDRDKVNVNGGAIALGHPIGATGAMLIGTVLDELERQDKQVGLVTMCAGGGMAPAIIIERVEWGVAGQLGGVQRRDRLRCAEVGRQALGHRRRPWRAARRRRGRAGSRPRTSPATSASTP